jgi:hypothetical protein
MLIALAGRAVLCVPPNDGAGGVEPELRSEAAHEFEKLLSRDSLSWCDDPMANRVLPAEPERVCPRVFKVGCGAGDQHHRVIIFAIHEMLEGAPQGLTARPDSLRF